MGIDEEDKEPLHRLDDWEEDLRARYPKGESAVEVATKSKKREEFRNYEATTKPQVREFYRLNHKYQTVDFVRAKRADYLRLNRKKLGLWDGLEFLNTLVDDSDPDTSLAQIEHLLQTAEAIRKDGHPRWFVLVGLLHDFGKVLCLFGEPQWAVVGDTFPVGCQFAKEIVFYDFLKENPDYNDPRYNSRLGIYEEHYGLDEVLLSWGHDEYMYHVVKDYLPLEALYMIRYHSFYPWHRERAYDFLTNDQDRKMLEAVRKFNPYDLYTKAAERPDVNELTDFYNDLWKEFLRPKLSF